MTKPVPRHFRLMSEQTTDGQLLLDRKGRFRYVNPAMRQLTGYDRVAWASMTVARLEPNLDRAALDRLFTDATAGRARGFETLVHCADQSTFPAEVNVTAITVDGEDLLFATVRDTTLRRQAEASLSLYRAAIEAAQQGICIADARSPEMPIIYCNDGFLEISGYERHEVLGHNCRFLQGPGTDPASVDLIRSAIAQADALNVTLVNYRKNGTAFWNSLSISPVFDSAGQLTYFVGFQKDVSSVYSAQGKEVQTAAQLLTLINTTAEGIYGLDVEGKCTFCNDTGLRLLGYRSEDQLVGRNMHEAIQHSHADGTPRKEEDSQTLATLREGRMLSIQDTTYWTRSGAALRVDHNSRPILVDGEVVGAVVSFSDASPRIAQEQQLTAALLDADAASRAKSEFLASVSHDIRTPLSAIVSHADLMLRSDVALDQAASQEGATAIKRNANSLLELLNDILDLSKIEAEQLEVINQPVAMASLLDDLMSMMQVRAAQKNLALQVEVSSPFPEIIQSDRVRLRQILGNLVSNAIKFTERGFVRITVGYKAPDLVLIVEDSGIGIPADRIAQLFEPFQQGGRHIAQRFGGTGLGLSISRRLLDKMGGSIRAESVPNEGSRFLVSLPAGNIDGARMLTEIEVIPAEEQPVAAPALAALRGTVLIAEDSAELLATTSELLTHCGATVCPVSDGVEALREVRAAPDRFDLLLLDIEMPRMDGLALTRTLREEGHSGPIIALTAQTMKGDQDRALAAGFDAFLAKPVDAELLVNTLKRLMHQANRPPPGATVLVVDDHADSSAALAQLLQLEQCEVYTAHNGNETRHLLQTVTPDLCLLDVNLPDIDGPLLLQELKAMSNLAATTFVATTGEVGAAAEARFLAAGFDHYLPKPVDLEKLKQLIRPGQATAP